MQRTGGRVGGGWERLFSALRGGCWCHSALRRQGQSWRTSLLPENRTCLRTRIFRRLQAQGGAKTLIAEEARLASSEKTRPWVEPKQRLILGVRGHLPDSSFGLFVEFLALEWHGTLHGRVTPGLEVD